VLEIGKEPGDGAHNRGVKVKKAQRGTLRWGLQDSDSEGSEGETSCEGRDDMGQDMEETWSTASSGNEIATRQK
jgi:hypothetical protein